MSFNAFLISLAIPSSPPISSPVLSKPKKPKTKLNAEPIIDTNDPTNPSTMPLIAPLIPSNIDFSSLYSSSNPL